MSNMTIGHFIPLTQARVIKELLGGEEGQHFRERLSTMNGYVQTLPKLHERQDEQLAALHFFSGGCDWYVTAAEFYEGDLDVYGWANLGDPDCAEYGYLSLSELRRHPQVEIDLYFTPTPMSQIIAKHNAA